MKKVAQILGLVIINLVAAIYLLIILGGIFDGEPIQSDFESIGMAVLVGLTFITVVLTWFKRQLGAWSVLIIGILFTIFALITADRMQIIAVMAAGGPLIIGSLLILLGLESRKA
jgi:hypothetical protein